MAEQFLQVVPRPFTFQLIYLTFASSQTLFLNYIPLLCDSLPTSLPLDHREHWEQLQNKLMQIPAGKEQIRKLAGIAML